MRVALASPQRKSPLKHFGHKGQRVASMHIVARPPAASALRCSACASSAFPCSERGPHVFSTAAHLPKLKSGAAAGSPGTDLHLARAQIEAR